MAIYQQMIKQDIDLETNFNEENFRLISLASWTNAHVPKEKLARFGFYHALQNDHVKCYFCEVVIGDWGIGDDPLTEHYKHSPNCPLINMQPTTNIPCGDVKDFNEELLKLNKTKSLVIYETNPEIILDQEIRIPRHPDYADPEKRFLSFRNWPKSLKQTPENLSEAGFFYLGAGDEVKCFHCAGCLKDWEPNDLGLEEHKKHFEAKCGFIKSNYLILKKKMSHKSPKELVKATPHQIKSLIDYMNDNTDLRDGKVNSANNKESYIEMWEQLVKYLNSLEGPKKPIKAWREVWRNHKYNKKRKPNPGTNSVVIEEIFDDNFKEEHEIPNSQPIQYNINSQDTAQIKTIPKKRKYNETADQITYLLTYMESNPQQKINLLNQTEFSPEWVQLVARLNDMGCEQKNEEDWANIWRNQYYETETQNTEIVLEHKPILNTIQHTSEITSYEPQHTLNENVPMAKVVPKKRKLEEYTKEAETEAITEYKQYSDLMQMKYKNLEFEKMQLELENQKKQLEIEKLKMQLEFAETKRQLEIQKDELEKEKNRLAMERTSILIPIQSNFE